MDSYPGLQDAARNTSPDETSPVWFQPQDGRIYMPFQGRLLPLNTNGYSSSSLTSPGLSLSPTSATTFDILTQTSGTALASFSGSLLSAFSSLSLQDAEHNAHTQHTQVPFNVPFPPVPEKLIINLHRICLSHAMYNTRNAPLMRNRTTSPLLELLRPG